MIKNLPYLLALHSINGLGPIRLKKLLNHYHDPKIIWEENPKFFQEIGIPKSVTDLISETKKTLNPEQFAIDIENSQIKVLTYFDPQYPKLLKEIYDPPIILYYQGNLDCLKLYPAIAIVGTRKISGYGRTITEYFTQILSQAGLVIVSGLARGVDTVAHQSTLSVQGKTIAVLGGGLNQIYPPENTRLAQNIIASNGLIFSEYPPDYPHLASNFPSRNRIISGLSKGVLVTEAALDSGSLITARLALEHNREVYAIPGQVTSNLSKGPALLIKEGAKLVEDPQEILDDLKISPGNLSKLALDLNPEEQTLLDCLENESVHIDELCRILQKSSANLSSLLLQMEIKGIIKNLGGGVYSRSF